MGNCGYLCNVQLLNEYLAISKNLAILNDFFIHLIYFNFCVLFSFGSNEYLYFSFSRWKERDDAMKAEFRGSNDGARERSGDGCFKCGQSGDDVFLHSLNLLNHSIHSLKTFNNVGSSSYNWTDPISITFFQ